MDGADVGEDRGAGAHKRREGGDLAGVVGAGLEDRVARSLGHGEDGFGEAEGVVPVAARAGDGAERAEEAGGELLDGGLADGAGDAEDERIDGGAPAGGEVAQGAPGVVDAKRGKAGREGRGAVGDDGARAGGDGLRGEGVSVEAFAAERDEEAARGQFAGIGGDGGEGARQRPLGAGAGPADEVGEEEHAF